jgi:hypothetical protein
MRNINRKFYNAAGKQLFFVYLLGCKVNGKRYAGFSSDPERRWEKERQDAYNPIDQRVYNSPLSVDIRKFGWKNFTQEVILTSNDKSDALSAERQCIEQYKLYIRKYGTEFGYNQTPGGISPPLKAKGSIVSTQTRQKISATLKGRKLSAEHAAKSASAHLILTTEKQIVLCNLYLDNKDLSVSELARQLSYAKETVRLYLKRNNITIRQAKSGPKRKG